MDVKVILQPNQHPFPAVDVPRYIRDDVLRGRVSLEDIRMAVEVYIHTRGTSVPMRESMMRYHAVLTKAIDAINAATQDIRYCAEFFDPGFAARANREEAT